jgi:hypothetical protein
MYLTEDLPKEVTIKQDGVKVTVKVEKDIENPEESTEDEIKEDKKQKQLLME